MMMQRVIVCCSTKGVISVVGSATMYTDGKLDVSIPTLSKTQMTNLQISLKKNNFYISLLTIQLP